MWIVSMNTYTIQHVQIIPSVSYILILRNLLVLEIWKLILTFSETQKKISLMFSGFFLLNDLQNIALILYLYVSE